MLLEELGRRVAVGHVLRADQGQDAAVDQQVGGPFDELAFHAAFFAGGVVVGRIAPDERERAVTDRRSGGSRPGPAIGLRATIPAPWPHGPRTIRCRREPHLALAASCTSAWPSPAHGSRMTHSPRVRRSEPLQHGGDGFGGGGIVAAFDLRHEPGHCSAELLGGKVGSILVG